LLLCTRFGRRETFQSEARFVGNATKL
jgi:hypothetical protein